MKTIDRLLMALLLSATVFANSWDAVSTKKNECSEFKKTVDSGESAPLYMTYLLARERAVFSHVEIAGAIGVIVHRGDDSNQYQIFSYALLPQDWENGTIQIKYKINDGEIQSTDGILPLAIDSYQIPEKGVICSLQFKIVLPSSEMIQRSRMQISFDNLNWYAFSFISSGDQIFE